MDSALKERWDELWQAGESLALEVELAERFVRDYPDFGPAWIMYGRGLTRLSRFDEAERAIRRAMELSPREDLFLMCDLGKLYQHKGEVVNAEKCFRKAIAGDPQDATGYVYLGAMLARLGRLCEAEAIHRRATKCPKGCADESFHNLGLVLRALGRYDEAIECFAEAIRRDPQYKDAKLAMRDCKRAAALVRETLSSSSENWQ